jgi:hypothetical protein
MVTFIVYLFIFFMPTPKQYGILAAVLLPVIVAVGFVMKDSDADDVAIPQVAKDTPTPSVPSVKSEPAPETGKTPTPTSVPSTTYTNGTYSAQGTYNAPDGKQSITVSLTVTSDVVTDATVTPGTTSGVSGSWQSTFIKGYREQVVGKKLADLKLKNVSGASLTPIAFNIAVEAIRTQAM